MTWLDLATWLAIAVLVFGASAVFLWFVVDVFRPRSARRPDDGSLGGGDRLLGGILLALAVGLTGCNGERLPPVDRGPPSEWASGLQDSVFGRLHEELSEPGGYFDTDNLISNEGSYLHVLGALEALGVSGGAYVGVGPDQNFSYIATVRPAVAFILDIRRDNALEHLLFKALFESAPTRAEYLGLLIGRIPPAPDEAWERAAVGDLVRWFDEVGPDEGAAARARVVVDSAVVTFGVALSETDRATIRRFHDEFLREGLGLRFRSFGRAPRPYYPTLRSLLLATDLTGAPRSYLAGREDYVFLRELQRRNLVIPVVGDLAGPRALRAIGNEVRSRGERVSTLYVSNVEFYLYRAGSFGAFAENVLAMPWSSEAAMIRSYFPTGGGPHPHAVPGFYSTQTLVRVTSFERAMAEGGYGSYRDLVTREAVDPREPQRR